MRDPRNIVNDEARRHAAAPSRIGRPCAVGRAFTLIELLTVIGIIAILIGVLFPAIRALMNSGQVEAGINTINVATSAARTYATTLRRASLHPTVTDADFDGAAAIFCPSGEIRLVENSQAAVDGSGDFLETNGKNGYVDISGVDYISLPKGTGVVGISRGGAAPGTLYLFAPPFAIRFNREGGLIAGISEAHRLVYYDGNYDGEYDQTGTGSTRGLPYGGGPYNPDKWDPTSDSYQKVYNADNNYGLNPTTQKHTLPFEAIETVVGVIVFDKNDLRAARYNLESSGTGNPVNTNAANWILANGKPILFSRLTGKMMRE